MHSDVDVKVLETKFPFSPAPCNEILVQLELHFCWTLENGNKLCKLNAEKMTVILEQIEQV